MATTYFAHKATHQFKIGTTLFSPLWALLFGVVYFACKGIGAPFLLVLSSLVIWALLEFAGLVLEHFPNSTEFSVLIIIISQWIIFIALLFFYVALIIRVEYVVTTHMLKKGWEQISEAEYHTRTIKTL